jgi:hypothetical protein
MRDIGFSGKLSASRGQTKFRAPMMGAIAGCDRRHAEAGMTLLGWKEEAIPNAHDRISFDCGDAELNIFL